MSLTWTLITILCLLGVLAIADTDWRRHLRQRQYRHAHRAQLMEQRTETAATLHHLADSQLLWHEFDKGERMPGLEQEGRWDG